MRFLFTLALFAVSALAVSSSHWNRQSIRLNAGQTYVYDYSSRLLTGSPQIGDQFAGFEIKADLILQPRGDSVVAMKLANIKLGKHNGPIGDDFPNGEVVMDHQMNAQYQKELTKPIRFVYSEGKVKAFEADISEPEWSLNMKKAILSLWNVNLQPKKIIKSPQNNQILRPEADLTVYPIYEDGIGGICETVYEINNIVDPKYRDDQDEAFVLNVTKTRNYENCLTEPTIVNDNFDVRGCPSVCRKEKSFSAVNGYYPTPDAVTDPYMSGCPCGKEPHESPVDSFNFVKYNISLQQSVPLIEGIYSEGKTVYKTNGDELLIITQQNVTLNAQGKANVVIPAIPRPQRHSELSFRIPKPVLPQGVKVPLDIPYYHLFGEPNVQELQDLVPELLDSLASDIVSGELATAKDSMQKSVQMVNAMAVLPQEALHSIWEEVAQQGHSQRATQKEQVVRKLYLDALPLAGSNPSALFIAYLIQQNKVTTFEAKELVEAVPQNLFLIDTQTLDAYLELFQSPKVQSRRHLAASAGIAFGKMVKEGCVKRQSTPGDIPDDNQVPHPKRNLPAQLVVQNAHPQQAQRVTVVNQQRTSFSQRMKRSIEWEDSFSQDVCDSTDVEKYVQIIARLLSQAKSFHKKVTLIETLAHMGVPQVLPVLQPYISGELPESQCPGYITETKEQTAEECDFIRRIAVYALKHVTEHYPKQVLPLVIPLYSDRSESYELRIAAFTTLLFADAEKQVLERIASELHSEPNRQIKSFVSSSFEQMGNNSLPCYESMAQKAAQAYQHSPRADFGYQYSKMIQKSFYEQNKDFGLYSVANWVANNNSRVPRAGYWSVGQSNGPFQDELVQLGFQAKGMENIVNRIFSTEGLLSDMFSALSKGKDRRITKRSVDSAQQALEALKNQLSQAVRSDDEPKATVFFKLFDRTSYYAFDRHYVHSLIDEAEDWLKDLAQILLNGQTYHYVKLVMPSQLYKVVPSEVGLPLVITHRHPIIFSLKVDQAKLQVSAEPKTVIPLGANITAQIQPSIFYSSYAFAFAVNTADRQTYGTHVQKTTHLTLPTEVSVGFSRPKNQLTWSIVPRETEVVYHKTQTQTFIAKAAIAGAPDRDWLQEAHEVKTMAVPLKHDYQFGQQWLGIGIRGQLNSENPWDPIQSLYNGETYENHGLIASVVESWRNPGLYPRELHLQIESDREEPIQGYDFSLRYKWVSDDEESSDDDDSDESSASDESDSDQSDESSASHSSESNSSESNSDEKDDKKSKSSQSSEESNESNVSIKKRIRNRMSKVVSNVRQRRNANKYKINVENNENYNNDNNNKESNESSDESSNESGSKSFSKSGSKESSQSSSSESDSSEEKHRHRNGNKNKSKYNSKSAQSSESDSSSSESDESHSFEDNLFDYEDVMKLILGQDFRRRNIKRITQQLIRKTQKVWETNWDEDWDQSSEDESEQNESTEVPQTIAHDIVLTAVARGPRPSYYAANILYVHTFDHRINWLKTDGHIKTPKGVYMTVPTLFCSDVVLSYPTLPNEFYYEHLEGQKARISAQMGWGQQCQSEGGLLLTGVMEQTEDHVITPEQLGSGEGASPAHVQSWFYRQCAIDRSEGQSQSYACDRAIIEDSYFNQIIIDLKYKNVPKEIQNLTQKANLALKVNLYSHLEYNGLNVDNPDKQIRLVTQFSQRIPDIPLANLLIKTPEENQQYSHIHIPLLRPPSTLLPISQVYSNLWTGYEGFSQDSCSLMENYVRTFDNVTFKTEDTVCQYLVAKDCSAHERFAVFAQNQDVETKTKIVTVMTSGSEIKLLPPQQKNVAQVIVDGKAHEIEYRKPVTIGAQNKNAIRVYLRATPSEAQNPIVVVESDINDLIVKYDGKNVKVTIGGYYAGKTCGICGDNNDETEEEFAGPDMCVYDEAEDFFNSYALSGAHCAQRPQPIGQRRCPQNSQNNNEVNEDETGIVHRKEVKTVYGPNGKTTLVRQEVREEPSQAVRSQIVENQANVEQIQRQQQQQVENQMARQEGEPLSQSQQQQLYAGTPQQQKLIQRLRTQYITRDDMICFTTKPVLSCVGSGQPSALRQVKVDFHCLPKTSAFTQQLIVESEKQVIRQLVNKRVDLRQQIEVPVTCV